MKNNNLKTPFKAQCIDNTWKTGELTQDKWYTVTACSDNGVLYTLVNDQGQEERYVMWRFKLEGEL